MDEIKSTVPVHGTDSLSDGCSILAKAPRHWLRPEWRNTGTANAARPVVKKLLL